MTPPMRRDIPGARAGVRRGPADRDPSRADGHHQGARRRSRHRTGHLHRADGPRCRRRHASPRTGSSARSSGRPVPTMLPVSWYCDPVDGTTNFAHDLGWSSFSLCARDSEGPLVGVVAHPTRREVLLGQRGAGAWRITLDEQYRPLPDREPLRASDTDSLAGTVFTTELLSHRPWPGTAAMIELLADRSCTARIMGSSALTLAQVGAGRAAGAIIGGSPPSTTRPRSSSDSKPERAASTSRAPTPPGPRPAACCWPPRESPTMSSCGVRRGRVCGRDLSRQPGRRQQDRYTWPGRPATSRSRSRMIGLAARSRDAHTSRSYRPPASLGTRSPAPCP